MTITAEQINKLAPNIDLQPVEPSHTHTHPPQTTPEGTIGVQVEQEDDLLTEALQTALHQRQHEQNNFAKIDIQAARDKHLTPLQKTVYMILCTYRNNTTNQAWPSKETIAEHAGCKPNAVRNAFRALEQAGYVTTQKRVINNTQTSNMITFPTIKPAQKKAKPETTPPQQQPTYQQNKATTTNNSKQYWNDTANKRPKEQLFQGLEPITKPDKQTITNILKQTRQTLGAPT